MTYHDPAGALRTQRSFWAQRGRFVVFAAFLLTLMIGATLWRFRQWVPDVFYGDDLDYFLLFLDGQCATRAHEILTATCYERFRPVASGWVIAMMNLFGSKVGFYIAGNVLIQGLIGSFAFAIAYRLSQRNFAVAMLVALAVVTSRFAAYQVTQLIGPVESLTLLFILSAVYATIRADSVPSGAWRWAWIAVASAFVAANTHERSLVVAVWLAIAFAVSPGLRSMGPRRLLPLLAACVAIPVFYVAFKTFVLDAYFLVGTGGTHLDLGLPLVLEHGIAAVRSLLGFNSGPDYLVGISVTAAVPLAWTLAIAFSLLWLMLIVLAIYNPVAPIPRVSAPHVSALVRMRWPLLLLLLAAAMLLPALLTVRLEQRWLLAPFCLGLLATSCAVGDSQVTRRVHGLLVALLCASSIFLDNAITAHYDRIFFISSSRMATEVKRDIVDGYPRRHGGIALLAAANHCAWTLQDGGFFRAYGGKPRTVQCFSTLEEAIDSNLAAGTHVYGRVEANGFDDYSANAAKLSARRMEQKRYDFLENFDLGRLDDERRVSTPTGRGVLVMPWDSSGGIRQTLTLLTGFSYQYQDVRVAAGDELRFGVMLTYPAPQPARLTVLIRPQGGSQRILYSADIAAPKEGGNLHFREIEIPLNLDADTIVGIEFTVESPGGDSTGHWVALADPRIVRIQIDRPDSGSH